MAVKAKTLNMYLQTMQKIIGLIGAEHRSSVTWRLGKGQQQELKGYFLAIDLFLAYSL